MDIIETGSVAPATFDAKMVRWPQISPDGRKVVFQSLGYVWVKDLPDGKPRRLTTQDERFELYPSWSRDGRNIVYVTWHDSELGDVRAIAVFRALADGRMFLRKSDGLMVIGAPSSSVMVRAISS